MYEKTNEYNQALDDSIRQHLSKEKSVLMSVSSCSMRPVFKEGDQIEVRKVNINDIVVGDVIVFSRNLRIFTHRVVKLVVGANAGIRLRTKGDMTLMFDRCVKLEELMGVVVSRQHRNNRVYFDAWTWRLFNKVVAAGSFLIGRMYLSYHSFKRHRHQEQNIK